MKLLKELIQEATMNAQTKSDESSPMVFVADDSDTGNEKAFEEFCRAHDGKKMKFEPDFYFCILDIPTSEISDGQWSPNLDQGESYSTVFGIIETVYDIGDVMSNAGDDGPALRVNFNPRVEVEVDCFHEDSFDHDTKKFKVKSGILHYTQIKRITVL